MGFVLHHQALEPRPSGVDRLLVLVIGFVCQPRPTLRAQSRAVRPTHRLKRQCEHHRVTQERFEVEQVVLELADIFFLACGDVVVIQVELLEVDADFFCDRLQAADAFADQASLRRTGEQYALHDCLKAQVEMDRLSLRHSEEFDA